MIQRISQLNLRKVFAAVFFVAASAFVVTLSSCEDDNELFCNRCTDDAPWSAPSGSSCYNTQADCEAAEGDECIICT